MNLATYTENQTQNPLLQISWLRKDACAQQSHIVMDKLPLVRGTCVLHPGISFVLNAGDHAVIQGPNGCGKTTLLHYISGVLRAPSPCIDALPHIYIPHDLSLFLDMSVQDNLRFFAHMLKVTYDPYNADDPFDIRPFLDRRIESLSHGQKHRVSLSRLFMKKAPIWLLDEPEQGLDQHFQTILRQVVNTHCTMGGSCLMASHTDMNNLCCTIHA